MSGVGGAIGPLYSTALEAVAAEIEATAAASSDAVALLRGAAEAAEAAVVGIGHATPGDKTVIDALHPLANALRDAEASAADVAHRDRGRRRCRGGRGRLHRRHGRPGRPRKPAR